MRTARRLAYVAVLVAPVTAQTAPANPPASPPAASAMRKDFYFYHGKDGGSSLVGRGTSILYFLQDGKQLRHALPTGSQVCVTVLNAHPVNYTYALGVAIDTTRPTVPALSAPFTALAGHFKRTERGSDQSAVAKLFQEMYNISAFKASEERPDAKAAPELSPVSDLGTAVRDLAEEVEAVETVAKASDDPEGLTAIDAQGAALVTGYRTVLAAIQAKPDGAGRFRSGKEKLTGHFEKLAAAATEKINKAKETQTTQARTAHAAESDALRNRLAEIEKEAKLLLIIKDALLDQGKELATKAGSLTTAFSAKGRVELCGKVGNGPTTVTLKIAPRDGGFGSGRDVKEAVSQEIILRPPYERETVSIHPIALVAMAGSVPQFQVENGTLTGPRDDDLAYRIGAAVNVNLFSFGPDGMGGFGIALGAGLVASSEVVSDLFVGPVVSLRDVVRIGIGVGASRFPSKVKGMTVGQPFDANAGKLEDLIETSMRRSYQLIFVLPGIKL
jgi:hypothetical protein